MMEFACDPSTGEVKARESALSSATCKFRASYVQYIRPWWVEICFDILKMCSLVIEHTKHRHFIHHQNLKKELERWPSG